MVYLTNVIAMTLGFVPVLALGDCSGRSCQNPGLANLEDETNLLQIKNDLKTSRTEAAKESRGLSVSRNLGLLDVDVCVGCSCDPSASTCNTAANKNPLVAATLPTGGPEQDLTPTEKTLFEHTLGKGLITSAAVQWAQREFARKMKQFLVKGYAKLHADEVKDQPWFRKMGQEGEQAIKSPLVFKAMEDKVVAEDLIDGRCDAHMKGYVGKLDQLEAAFETGNIREFWGAMYCLTKTNSFSNLLRALLEKEPETMPQWLETNLGMNAAAITGRWNEIKASSGLGDLLYSQGMPDFMFPEFDNWVRFDFRTTDKEGKELWGQCRVYKGCTSPSMRTDDPSIEPPLSAAEIQEQCGDEPSCPVQWYPGLSCFEVVDAPVGAGMPGFVERANALGYRVVAGPSGTTANLLVIAKQLGFTQEECALLRATMAAWMLPMDDHSFFEIMLGGQPSLTADYHLEFGPNDFERLFPKDVTVSDGTKFSKAEFWESVGSKFRESAATQALLAKTPLGELCTKPAPF